MEDWSVLYFTWGGLNKNGFHRLCLNNLSTVGGCVWEGLEGVVLLKEVCH